MSKVLKEYTSEEVAKVSLLNHIQKYRAHSKLSTIVKAIWSVYPAPAPVHACPATELDVVDYHRFKGLRRFTVC